MFWYHLTTRNFGTHVTLIPRAKGLFRPDNEPEIPRICVAPTMHQCLLALGTCLDNDINVYAAGGDPTPCWGVKDSEVTDEHWFLEPTTFTYSGTIELTGELDFYLSQVVPFGITEQSVIDKLEQLCNYAEHPCV